MNTRITVAILLAVSPFVTTVADTNVVLPHSQRFAETGRGFLLETTIPGEIIEECDAYVSWTNSFRLTHLIRR